MKCFSILLLRVLGQGVISSTSLYATAGSDVTDDLESFTQEPLQPQPVSGASSEDFPSSQPYYSSAPAPRTDVLASLGNLSLTTGKTEEVATFAPFSRPADLSSVGVGPRMGDAYPSFPVSAPPSMPAQVRTTIQRKSEFQQARCTPTLFSLQTEEHSPTTKLHRLLAESRQMVQNLEQTSFSAPSSTSPKQVGPVFSHVTALFYRFVLLTFWLLCVAGPRARPHSGLK